MKEKINNGEVEPKLKNTDFRMAKFTDSNFSKLLSRFKDETTEEAIQTLRKIESEIKNFLSLKKQLNEKNSKINIEKELLKKKLIDGNSRYERALVENVSGSEIFTDEALKNLKAENTDFERSIKNCEDKTLAIEKLIQENAVSERKIPEVRNAAKFKFLKIALKELSAKIDEPTRKLVREAWAIRSRMGSSAGYSELLQNLFPRTDLEEHTKIWNNFARKWKLVDL